ncbi:MAG: hypothetical protein MK078_16250 [Crocinitomicaceae bacterium]|nr:hypothetical protein [Crocinitomicaceae bacterium]
MNAENRAASLEKANKLISRSTNAPEEVVELLEKTYIGTNGAQYQLLNTKDRIKHLLNPTFFFLLRNGKAIGNITICKRPIRINKTKTESFYIRYFAFDALFQGSEKPSRGQNKLHLYFEQLFNSTNLNLEYNNGEKSIYWAFIDPENQRSFKMREKFGFEEVGEFKTFIYQRFFPKESEHVRLIKSGELETCINHSKLFYADYNFYSQHRISEENYYVFEKDGKIKAGIKAFPSAWKIKSLPGKNGELLKTILPFIPISRRLINLKKHRFLATEGLWFDNEMNSNEIEEFLSGILKLTNHYSLFLWEDQKAFAIKGLNIRWGIMAKIKQDNPIKIIAKLNNYSSSAIEELKASPKYLSGFDMT